MEEDRNKLVEDGNKNYGFLLKPSSTGLSPTKTTGMALESSFPLALRVGQSLPLDQMSSPALPFH